MTKIAIAGIPRAGKTTLGKEHGCRSTDEVKDMEWSAASEEVATWFGKEDAIEGVTVPRALRKWLNANPTGKPCDELIWLGEPRERLTMGQMAMGKGAKTVMHGIIDELEARGTKVKGWTGR